MSLWDLGYRTYGWNSTFQQWQGYAYPDDEFNITLNTSNIRDINHSGKAFGVWQNLTFYNSAKFTLLEGQENTYLGNLPSGQENISSLKFSADQTTDFFDGFLFKSEDFSGSYNSSYDIAVKVVNLSVSGISLMKNATEESEPNYAYVNVSGNATKTNLTISFFNGTYTNITSPPYIRYSDTVNNPHSRGEALDSVAGIAC